MLSKTLRCISTVSRVISLGHVGMAPFSQLEKTSLRRDTSLTSACLVRSQYPLSSKPPQPSGTSTQWIGSDSRSWASSATGSATKLTSGSRKSKSAGILGGAIGVLS